MKKIFIASLFLFSGFGSIAQNVSAPAGVANSFHKDFPTAAYENWQKDGSNYVAIFKIDTQAMSAVYDKDGYRKEVRREIEENQLPKPVFDYILKKYPGAKLKGISKSTSDKAVFTYHVEIVKDSKLSRLIFDVNGKFKKKE